MKNRLWFYRKKMGYTQQQVAQLLSTFPTRISEYEHGCYLPTLKTAIQLSIVLRTSIPQLYPELFDHLKEVIEQRVDR